LRAVDAKAGSAVLMDGVNDNASRRRSSGLVTTAAKNFDFNLDLLAVSVVQQRELAEPLWAG
jgi:hypothetical protein